MYLCLTCLQQSLLTFASLKESGCDRGHHALQVHAGAARTDPGEPAGCPDRAEQEDPVQRGAQVHENRYMRENPLSFLLDKVGWQWIMCNLIDVIRVREHNNQSPSNPILSHNR